MELTDYEFAILQYLRTHWGGGLGEIIDASGLLPRDAKAAMLKLRADSLVRFDDANGPYHITRMGTAVLLRSKKLREKLDREPRQEQSSESPGQSRGCGFQALVQFVASVACTYFVRIMDWISSFF